MIGVHNAERREEDIPVHSKGKDAGQDCGQEHGHDCQVRRQEEGLAMYALKALIKRQVKAFIVGTDVTANVINN
jgi:hypothetical protein